jgi:Aldehyde dehydrogenase family
MFDRRAIDQAIANLVQHRQDWLVVTLPQRLLYLQKCMSNVQQVSAAWVEAAVTAKSSMPADLLRGEEWAAGPMAVLLYLRTMSRTLEAGNQPTLPAIRSIQDQLVATVFPDQWIDRLLWPGYRGEVWLEPGQPVSQGVSQPSSEPQTGRVVLVLGAGNISAIGILDSLHQLLVENRVVIIKINPVNEYLGEFITQIFQPLIADGFMAVVYGDGEVGSYLCQHPDIDTVHITGSHQTHQAIVWGATAAEQVDRQATTQPLLSKSITSELGCVTPVLVVPGNWSDRDLRWQARHVASMVVHNASFNCTAAQVLVLARGWSQRSLFLNYLRSELTQAPPRMAYYPGSIERYRAFLDHYPQAEILGSPESKVPWTLIPDVRAQAGELALTTEAFCGVLAEVSLEASTAADFLKEVGDFANNCLWGSLSAVLLIDERTRRAHPAQWLETLRQLRYGNMGVNIWTGANFAIPALTWGAFPGNSITEVESGIGVVHNAYLFEHPQKSILYAPFRMPIPPLYSIGAKNVLKVAQCYGNLQMRPNLGNLLRVLAANI